MPEEGALISFRSVSFAYPGAAEPAVREVTLEVRLSNVPARRLYEKYGFRPVGLRPNYYSDNGEDALIMTTDQLEGSAMAGRLAGLRDALEASPAPQFPDDEIAT